MADFIRCGCPCHVESLEGRYHCLSGPCCNQPHVPKMFPMLSDEGKPTPPIPWSLAKEIYKVYREICGNDQTLEQIAERGGFAYSEIQVFMRRYQGKLEKK